MEKTRADREHADCMYYWLASEIVYAKALHAKFSVPA